MDHSNLLPQVPIIGWMFLIVILVFGSAAVLTTGRGEIEEASLVADKWFNRSLIILVMVSPLIVVEGIIIRQENVLLHLLLLGLSFVFLAAYTYSLIKCIITNLFYKGKPNDDI